MIKRLVFWWLRKIGWIDAPPPIPTIPIQQVLEEVLKGFE